MAGIPENDLLDGVSTAPPVDTSLVYDYQSDPLRYEYGVESEAIAASQEAIPEPRPAQKAERDIGFFSNAFRGAGERYVQNFVNAGELVSDIGNDIGNVTGVSGIAERAWEATPDFAGGNFKENLNTALEADVDYGYEETVSIDDIEQSFNDNEFATLLKEVAQFSTEQGILMTGDILARATGVIPWVMGEFQRQGESRAENDNREEWTYADMAAVAPSVAINFFSLGFFGKVADPIKAKAAGKLEEGLLAAIGRTAKKGAEGAVVEAVEEEVEYIAQGAGTETGLTVKGARQSAIGGALPGGTLGIGGNIIAEMRTGVDPVDQETDGQADSAEEAALDEHSGAADDARVEGERESLRDVYLGKLSDHPTSEASPLSNEDVAFVVDEAQRIADVESPTNQAEATDALIRALEARYPGKGQEIYDYALADDSAGADPLQEENNEDLVPPTPEEFAATLDAESATEAEAPKVGEIAPLVQPDINVSAYEGDPDYTIERTPLTEDPASVTIPNVPVAPFAGDEELSADQGTVLESQEEIDSQLAAFEAGTKPAMLFNNNETVEEVQDLLKRRGIKNVNVKAREGVGIVAYKKGAKTADGKSVGTLLHPQTAAKNIGNALGYGSEADAKYEATKGNQTPADPVTVAKNPDGTLALVLDGPLADNEAAAKTMFPDAEVTEVTREEATAERSNRDSYNVATDPTAELTPEQTAQQHESVQADGTAQSEVDAMVDYIDNKNLFQSETRTNAKGEQVAMKATTLRDQLYDVISRLAPVVKALEAEGKDTTAIKFEAMNALMNAGSISLKRAKELTWSDIVAKHAKVTSMTHGKSRVSMTQSREGAKNIKRALAHAAASESKAERSTKPDTKPETKAGKAKATSKKRGEKKADKAPEAKEETKGETLLEQQERIMAEAKAAANERGESATKEQQQQGADNDAKDSNEIKPGAKVPGSRRKQSIIVAGLKAFKAGGYKVDQMKQLIKLIDPALLPKGAPKKAELERILNDYIDSLINKGTPKETGKAKVEKVTTEQKESKKLWESLNSQRENMASGDPALIKKAIKYIKDFGTILTGKRELDSQALRDSVEGDFSTLTFADMRSIMRRVLMGEPLDGLTIGPETEFAEQMSKAMDGIIPVKSLGEWAKLIGDPGDISRDVATRLNNATPNHKAVRDRILRVLERSKSVTVTDINDFLSATRDVLANTGKAHELRQMLTDLGVSAKTAFQYVDNITVAREILSDRGAVTTEDSIQARAELTEALEIGEIVADEGSIREEGDTTTEAKKLNTSLTNPDGSRRTLTPEEMDAFANELLGDDGTLSDESGEAGKESEDTSRTRDRNVHGDQRVTDAGDMIDENDSDTGATFTRINPDGNPVGEATNSPLFRSSKKWARARQRAVNQVRMASGGKDFSSKQAMEILVKYLPRFDPLRLVAKALLTLNVDTPMFVGQSRLSEEQIDKYLRDKDGYIDPNVGGFHTSQDNFIYINNTHTWAETLVAMIHETVHAATSVAMRTNPAFRTKIRALRHKANDVLAAALEGDSAYLMAAHDMTSKQADAAITQAAEAGSFEIKYGMEDDLEFLAVGLSDPGFMQLLASISGTPPGRVVAAFRQIYNEFVGAINKMLGLPDIAGSALESLFTLTMQYGESTKRQVSKKAVPGVYEMASDATYGQMVRQDQRVGEPVRGFTDTEREDYGISTEYEAQFSRRRPQGRGTTPTADKKANPFNRARSWTSDKMRYALGFALTHTIVDWYGDTEVDLEVRQADGTMKKETVTPIKAFDKVRRAIRVEAEQFVRKYEENVVALGERLREQYPEHENTFARLITEMTMFNIDPFKPFPQPKKNKAGVRKKTAAWKTRKAAHARIAAEFNSLPSAHTKYAKGMGMMTKKAATDSRLLSIQSIGEVWGLKQSVIDQLKAATTQADLDAILARPEVMRMRVPKGAPVGTAKRWLPTELKPDQWADMKSQISAMNKVLETDFYFPLMRFGSHSVSATKGYTSPQYGTKAAATKASSNWKAAEGGRKTTGVKKMPNGKWGFTGEQKLYMEIEASEQLDTRAVLGKEGWSDVNITQKTEYNEAADQAKLANEAMALAQNTKQGGAKDLMKFVVAMSPASIAIQRKIRRDNVYGATNDVHRAFANYITMEGWSQAAIRNSNKLQTATNNMRYMARAGSGLNPKDQLRISQVVEELLARTGNRKVSGKLQSAASSLAGKFGFLNSLAGLSYPLVNLTQTVMITMPQLAGRYGFTATNREMAKAYWTLSRVPLKALYKSGAGAKELPGIRNLGAIKGDTLAKFGSSQELANLANVVPRMIAERRAAGDMNAVRALEQVQRSGLIESTLSKMINQVSTGNASHSAKRGKVDAVVDAASVMPFLAEIVNRATSAVATYNLEMAVSNDPAKAAEQTERVVSKTQIDYAGDNRSRYLQQSGEIVKVASMFKIYPIALASWMFEHTYTIATGKKGSRKESIKTMAAFNGALLAVSGVSGVLLSGPLSVFTNIMSAFFGEDDDEDGWFKFYAKHPEIALQQFVAETLRDKFPNMTDDDADFYANMFVDGPASNTIDLGSRVGTKQMFFMPARNTESATAAHLQQVYDFALGPIFGSGKGYATAIAGLEAGQSATEFLSRAAPKFVKDIAKASKMLDTGMTDFKGDELIAAEDYTTADFLVRVAGFTPGKETLVYRQRNWKKGLDYKIKTDRAKVMRLMRDAAKSKNRADGIRAFEAMDRYNKSLPLALLREKMITPGKILDNVTNQKDREMLTDKYGVQWSESEFPMFIQHYNK